MLTKKKTYPVVELSLEEEKELRYIFSVPDVLISQEELIRSRHTHEIYA